MVCFEILYLINEDENSNSKHAIARSKSRLNSNFCAKRRSNLSIKVQKMIKEIATGFASFGR
jgi:hypothetical protein